MRSSASVRRVGVSIFIIFLALTLHGLTQVSSREDASAAATPRPTPTDTGGPRPTSTPPSPRPTSTPPSPRPTPTDPYPGGASLPLAPDGDSFFRASESAPAPGFERGVASLMWITLALFALGLVVRWFMIAARNDDAG